MRATIYHQSGSNPTPRREGTTMALAHFDTDEERACRKLIQQAGMILTGLHGDMPESFAAQLFARAAPEDLAHYEARELAVLAEDAWAFLRERKPGTPQIRCETRSGPTGGE